MLRILVEGSSRFEWLRIGPDSSGASHEFQAIFGIFDRVVRDGFFVGSEFVLSSELFITLETAVAEPDNGINEAGIFVWVGFQNFTQSNWIKFHKEIADICGQG